MLRTVICQRRYQPKPSPGFTLVELLIVITMIGILAAMLETRISPTLQRTGAGNAASVIALDLEQAVSLAARQRRPVRITCDCANRSYTLTDRGTGSLLFQRQLGGSGDDLAAGSLTFSINPVDVFPSGLTSRALTVTVSAGTAVRLVTMSTGGFVRVVR